MTCEIAVHIKGQLTKGKQSSPAWTDICNHYQVREYRAMIMRLMRMPYHSSRPRVTTVVWTCDLRIYHATQFGHMFLTIILSFRCLLKSHRGTGVSLYALRYRCLLKSHRGTSVSLNYTEVQVSPYKHRGTGVFLNPTEAQVSSKIAQR